MTLLRVHKPIIGAFTLIALVAMMPISAVSAQNDELTAGQAVTGAISNASYMNVWRYESAGNETISVSVEATSGDLDTTLIVISANLDVLGVNDDIDPANDNFNSAIYNLTIPNADTIFVIVSRFNTQQGTSTGSYRLLLSTDTTAVISDEPVEPPATLTLDKTAIDGDLQDAFDHLIALGVIPDWKGTIAFKIPDGAFVESFRTDENQLFFPIGQDYRAADVIIRSDFIWDADDDDVACGIAFRAQNNGNAYAVYVGRPGWVELGRWENNGEDWVSLASWDAPDLNPRNGGKNNLVITAVDDEFHIFVNYELVGVVTDSEISGAGEFYVSLYKEKVKHLRCEFPALWVITQDQ